MEQTLAPAKAQIYNLSVTPEREFNDDKLREKLDKSSMLEGLLRQGTKREDFDWNHDCHNDHEVKRHLGAGIGLTRVAQFILNRTDIRACVPSLIHRDNAI
ncbi:hypothetical protein GCM10027048_35470 [Hymenobacter coalescens]